MSNTPQEIASFLRVYKNRFDSTAIGDFLSEGGIKPEEVEYWSQVRFSMKLLSSMIIHV